MEPLLIELTEAVAKAYQESGWIAAIATIILFGVRIYRIPVLQNVLPKFLRWDGLKAWVKMLIPFGCAFVGTLALSLAGSMPIATAIIAALTAGLASIGLHHGTKAIGALEAKSKPLNYQPGKLRKGLSIAVPIDKKFHAPPIK